MLDIQPKICPIVNAPIGQFKKPCARCAFYNDDVELCRIIQSNLILQRIERISSNPPKQ